MRHRLPPRLPRGHHPGHMLQRVHAEAHRVPKGRDRRPVQRLRPQAPLPPRHSASPRPCWNPKSLSRPSWGPSTAATTSAAAESTSWCRTPPWPRRGSSTTSTGPTCAACSRGTSRRPCCWCRPRCRASAATAASSTSRRARRAARPPGFARLHRRQGRA